MSIHDRFDLPYWIAQFPLERLRAQAREFVIERRNKLPNEYPSEADVDRHIRLMEPDAEILMGPGSLAVNEQLRAEAFAGGPYRGARIATDVFVWARGDPPHPATTKIGGLPYRHRSSAWPQDSEGRPIRFIAQFCFADSRDISGNLPGDVLLIFGDHEALLAEPERLVFEWSNLGIRELALEAAPMAGDELLTPYYGIIHRTEDWPDTEMGVFEGAKIGGLPRFIQDEPTLPGRFLAALGSISAGYSAYPVANEPEPQGWSGSDLMIGDMGSLYLFLDRSGGIHAKSQFY
jgi:Domain of unknown function (DUF1963)